MSISNTIESAYQQATGSRFTPIVFVNYGKKYISVKIEEHHLTAEQMVQFRQLLTDKVEGRKVLRIINSWSVNRYNETNRSQKVLVRLEKLTR